VSEVIRKRIEGRGCVLRGDDIDTDRIHPFDDERYRGANIMIVGQNFGCGSSREHAPQALMRSGFDAFVGGSFAEIFFGNCTALGLPCVTLSPGDLSALMDSVTVGPDEQLKVDLEAREVHHRGTGWALAIPDGIRDQLLEGTWNATAVLLGAGDAIEETAKRLPYVTGFSA